MRRAALLAAIAALAGCVGVERSDWFTPDHERALAEVLEDAEVVAEGGPKPRFESPPKEPEGAPVGPLALSLEQATLLAIRNNRDLALRRLRPVVTGAFELIERGVFDPEAFAELEFVDERAEEASRSTRDKFQVEGTESRAEVGVRQDLPSGTAMEARIEQERRASNRAPEQQTARIGLTVTQSLLRGFGSAVTLARVEQAKLEAQASRHELRGFTEALVADVRIAYWRHALAEREIAIFEESLAVARQQLDEVEQRVAVGVLPKAESPSAHVEVSRREQALIEARSALEEQRLRLLRLIDAGGGGSLRTELTLTSGLDTAAEPVTDVEQRVRLALASRPDLKEARLRFESDRLETVVTTNGLLPRLELFAAIDRTGFDDTFTGSFRELSLHSGEITVGLSLSHSLDNRTATGRNVQARATRRQSARAIANLEQQIELDVRLAVNEVERARQQISASSRTRELQAELLEAEKERFDVGVSTGLLVAQAQRDLLAAQIAEVESLVAYRIALLRLWLAEGSLLERSGIAVDG